MDLNALRAPYRAQLLYTPVDSSTAANRVASAVSTYVTGFGGAFSGLEPYRLNEIEQKVMVMEGVQEVEGWQFIGGDLLDDKGVMLETVTVFGPPADSELTQPILLEGRWIQPGDVRKLAISEGAKKYYPDLQAGDYINLKIEGHEELWQVIGLFKFVDRGRVTRQLRKVYILARYGGDEFILLFQRHTSAWVGW